MSTTEQSSSSQHSKSQNASKKSRFRFLNQKSGIDVSSISRPIVPPSPSEDFFSVPFNNTQPTQLNSPQSVPLLGRSIVPAKTQSDKPEQNEVEVRQFFRYRAPTVSMIPVENVPIPPVLHRSYGVGSSSLAIQSLNPTSTNDDLNNLVEEEDPKEHIGNKDISLTQQSNEGEPEMDKRDRGIDNAKNEVSNAALLERENSTTRNEAGITTLNTSLGVPLNGLSTKPSLLDKYSYKHRPKTGPQSLQRKDSSSQAQHADPNTPTYAKFQGGRSKSSGASLSRKRSQKEIRETIKGIIAEADRGLNRTHSISKVQQPVKQPEPEAAEVSQVQRPRRGRAYTVSGTRPSVATSIPDMPPLPTFLLQSTEQSTEQNSALHTGTNNSKEPISDAKTPVKMPFKDYTKRKSKSFSNIHDVTHFLKKPSFEIPHFKPRQTSVSSDIDDPKSAPSHSSQSNLNQPKLNNNIQNFNPLAPATNSSPIISPETKLLTTVLEKTEPMKHATTPSPPSRFPDISQPPTSEKSSSNTKIPYLHIGPPDLTTEQDSQKADSNENRLLSTTMPFGSISETGQKPSGSRNDLSALNMPGRKPALNSPQIESTNTSSSTLPLSKLAPVTGPKLSSSKSSPALSKIFHSRSKSQGQTHNPHHSNPSLSIDTKQAASCQGFSANQTQPLTSRGPYSPVDSAAYYQSIASHITNASTSSLSSAGSGWSNSKLRKEKKKKKKKDGSATSSSGSGISISSAVSGIGSIKGFERDRMDKIERSENDDSKLPRKTSSSSNVSSATSGSMHTDSDMISSASMDSAGTSSTSLASPVAIPSSSSSFALLPFTVASRTAAAVTAAITKHDKDKKLLPDQKALNKISHSESSSLNNISISKPMVSSYGSPSLGATVDYKQRSRRPTISVAEISAPLHHNTPHDHFYQKKTETPNVPYASTIGARLIRTQKPDSTFTRISPVSSKNILVEEDDSTDNDNETEVNFSSVNKYQGSKVESSGIPFQQYSASMASSTSSFGKGSGSGSGYESSGGTDESDYQYSCKRPLLMEMDAVRDSIISIDETSSVVSYMSETGNGLSHHNTITPHTVATAMGKANGIESIEYQNDSDIDVFGFLKPPDHPNQVTYSNQTQFFNDSTPTTPAQAVFSPSTPIAATFSCSAETPTGIAITTSSGPTTTVASASPSFASPASLSTIHQSPRTTTSPGSGYQSRFLRKNITPPSLTIQLPIYKNKHIIVTRNEAQQQNHHQEIDPAYNLPVQVPENLNPDPSTSHNQYYSNPSPMQSASVPDSATLSDATLDVSASADRYSPASFEDGNITAVEEEESHYAQDGIAINYTTNVVSNDINHHKHSTSSPYHRPNNTYPNGYNHNYSISAESKSINMCQTPPSHPKIPPISAARNIHRIALANGTTNAINTTLPLSFSKQRPTASHISHTYSGNTKRDSIKASDLYDYELDFVDEYIS